ncbi:Pentatricopeptide repeat-containing protein [Drosera capensis]
MKTPVQLLTSVSFLAGDNHHKTFPSPPAAFQGGAQPSPLRLPRRLTQMFIIFSHHLKTLIPNFLSTSSPKTLTLNHSLRFLSSYRRSNCGGIGRAGWGVGVASSPSLSIWRRKKELGKEGLIVAKELKRLQSNPQRLDGYIRGSVSRLLKSDLVAVLAEFQRQDLVFLCLKLYDVVRKEIWYRPDMFFYRDMLMMLAKNKKVDEVKRVWADLKGEEVLFDQHTFGDIMRAFLDSGLPKEAMDIYDEMRQSPDPPLSLPYRVILKGLVPYPELREKVKDDFLELFPGLGGAEPLIDGERTHRRSFSGVASSFSGTAITVARHRRVLSVTAWCLQCNSSDYGVEVDLVEQAGIW